MSMADQFQKLDDLIMEDTRTPVLTILRNQLALTRQQVEAYQASSDRQDQTLAAQAETIAALQIANRGRHNLLFTLAMTDRVLNFQSMSGYVEMPAGDPALGAMSTMLKHNVPGRD